RRISRLTVVAIVGSFLSARSCAAASGVVSHPDHCSVLLITRSTFLCRAFSISSLTRQPCIGDTRREYETAWQRRHGVAHHPRRTVSRQLGEEQKRLGT